MTDIVSNRDVEDAVHLYRKLTVPRDGVSEISRLVHNDNLFTALVAVAEAKLAEEISNADPKLAADKVKWKARASRDYHKALIQAARAAGELASARLEVRGAENTIEIWRTQQANNRKGHL